MLTPDQMDAAGEEVAAVYRQIEAELIDYLVSRMIDGDVSGQRARTALDLLAQADPEQLRRIIDAHAEEVDAAARRDVERYLAASDAFDLAAIAAGMAVTAPTDALTAQTLAVTASVREMIARDNLEMSNAARTKFLQWSTWAATQTATGNMTAGKAMRRAVRELARGGLSIESVTYRDPETGKVTVTNKADVAVQRHIRSLIGQGAAALTFERMRQNGVEFVEVSSHIGSRPSHAEWQGRCYHVGGAVEVDGARYEDFAFGTGYRGECGPYTALGDQLMGVNCRHSFAPWVPGGPRAYSPDPESPTGLPNDEIYELTQGQRARERKIREAKRELAAMQRVYDADPTPENAAELAKAKALLRSRQERMRAYIADANAKCRPGTEALKRMPSREWAGDMPKIAPKPDIMGSMRHEEPLVSLIGREQNGYSVSPSVNTRSYHAAFEKMPVPKPVAEGAYREAGRILDRATGHDEEFLAAIDAKTGEPIVNNLGRDGTPRHTYFNDEEAAALDRHEGQVIVIHNHPHSGPPSYGDVVTASRNDSIAGSIVIGHDGSVWFVSADGAAIAEKLERAYNATKEELGDNAQLFALDMMIKRARKEGFVWEHLR